MADPLMVLLGTLSLIKNSKRPRVNAVVHEVRLTGIERERIATDTHRKMRNIIAGWVIVGGIISFSILHWDPIKIIIAAIMEQLAYVGLFIILATFFTSAGTVVHIFFYPPQQDKKDHWR